MAVHVIIVDGETPRSGIDTVGIERFRLLTY